jgi:hypothetical protein
MRKLIVIPAVAMLALSTVPAWAVPMCDGPRFEDNDGVHINLGFGLMTEEEAAQHAEMRLRMRGINANMTRFWNGCIQTFVREGGHDTMRFYDPDTLEEIPVD